MPTEPNFKFCLHCGQKIPTEATFCPSCGAKQPTTDLESSSAPEKSVKHDSAPKTTSDQESTLETNADTAQSDSGPGPTVVFTPTSEPTPTSDRPNMASAFDRGVKAAFTIKGRFSRADYWWLYLDIVLISLVVTVLFSLVFFSKGLVLSPGKTIAFLLIGAVVAVLSVIQFTATIRRLHDTNRSGHFLWLSLIPTVGPIILLVLLTQPAVVADNRFTTSPASPHWTRTWWPWTILAVLSLVFAGSYASLSTITRTAVIASQTTATPAESATNDATKGGSLTLRDSQVRLSQQKTYHQAYQNSSWAKSTFAIDKVEVAKTAEAVKLAESDQQKAFNGVVAVHFKIKAGRDIAAYPTQATLNTNLGQQVNSDMSLSDTFDGDLNKGTIKDGNVYFLLPNLKSVASLTSIRLKWDAFYDTDDENDNSFAKNFDTTLKLN